MNQSEDFFENLFKAFDKKENIRIAHQTEIEKNQRLTSFFRVWRIDTEILDATSKLIEITFYLGLQKEFPFSLPKLFLSKESYDKVKYIPHVDTDRFICTFDSVNTIVNHSLPIEIIESCLKRAKNIIENGLAQSNFSDFEEEFISYWVDTYNKESTTIGNILSFIEGFPRDNKITLLELNKRVINFRFILYQKGNEADNFISFLEHQKIEIVEHEIFYFDTDIIPIRPPFDMKIGQIISKLEVETVSKSVSMNN